MDIKELTKKIKKVSEIYKSKYEIEADDTWYVLKLQEEMGELIQTYLMLMRKARSKNKSHSEIHDDFEKEVADVFCHIILLADYFKIDIDSVVQKKWLKWIE